MDRLQRSTSLIPGQHPLLNRLIQQLRTNVDAPETEADGFHGIADCVISNLHGAAGILWSRTGEDLEVIGESNLDTDDFDTDSKLFQRHVDIVFNAFDNLSCSVVTPFDFFQDYLKPDRSKFGELVSTHQQLVIPYIFEDRCEAVLVVFVDDSYRKWELLELIAVTQRIELFLLQRKNDFAVESQKKIEAENEVYGRLRRLQENISRNLDENKNAYDVANEIYAYLGQGRVTVSIFRGTSCQVKAVSGQTTFNRRAPVLRHIARLSAVAARTRQRMFMPEDQSELPRKIVRRFEKYFDAADTRSIALLPLIKFKEPATDPNNLAAVIRDRQSAPGKVVGVVAIEGLAAPLGSKELVPYWDPVDQIFSNSVANAHQYNGLFMMPVWKKLGQFCDLYRGHRRNMAILITLLIVGAIAALTFIKEDLKLRCNGVVQPINRSQVFAGVDGVVSKVHVDHGQTVKEGQTLISLTNPQLEADFAAVEGDLRETKASLTTVMRQRMFGVFENNKDSDAQDQYEQRRLQLLQKSMLLETRVKALEKRLKLLAEKRDRLTVQSPCDGKIVTWNVPNRLRGRPISRGDLLMAIADPNGKWELELRIPDRRAGYLLDDVASRAKSNQKVTYCLASRPTTMYDGQVRRVAPATNLDDKEGNVLRLFVDLNEAKDRQPESVRPGTEVVARVHVGQFSYGYCKVYEFVDFGRRLWFQFGL